MKKGTQLFIIVVLILVIDQVSKIWIKTTFYYGEELMLAGNWARLHFLENPGMAYGAKFSDLPVVGQFLEPRTAKFLLTIFRIGAVIFIISYIKKQLKQPTMKNGLLVSMALILAGAIGNIIDCVFYGKIFSESPRNMRTVATLFPEGGGYDTWFQGKVVDMFYFPMVQTTLPTWVPLKGGEYFEFFRPVFNVADASISVGIIMILLFYRKVFGN